MGTFIIIVGIIVGALLLAVIACGLVGPRTQVDPGATKRAEDNARMMEAIARGFF